MNKIIYLTLATIITTLEAPCAENSLGTLKLQPYEHYTFSGQALYDRQSCPAEHSDLSGPSRHDRIDPNKYDSEKWCQCFLANLNMDKTSKLDAKTMATHTDFFAEACRKEARFMKTEIIPATSIGNVSLKEARKSLIAKGAKIGRDTQEKNGTLGEVRFELDKNDSVHKIWIDYPLSKEVFFYQGKELPAGKSWADLQSLFAPCRSGLVLGGPCIVCEKAGVILLATPDLKNIQIAVVSDMTEY